LIVILDDATSEIYYWQLVEEESTRTVTAGLRAASEKAGAAAVEQRDSLKRKYTSLSRLITMEKHEYRILTNCAEWPFPLSMSSKT
jgi:hypothetical protein